jgi:hypothetical protein
VSESQATSVKARKVIHCGMTTSPLAIGPGQHLLKSAVPARVRSEHASCGARLNCGGKVDERGPARFTPARGWGVAGRRECPGQCNERQGESTLAQASLLPLERNRLGSAPWMRGSCRFCMWRMLVVLSRGTSASDS